MPEVRSVTITLEDADTHTTLPDVLVAIKNVGETTTFYQDRTDAGGQNETTLLDGTYHVLIVAPPGYNSPAPQVLVVADTVSAAYSLGRFVPATPSMPNLCRVYGFEYLNGQPVLGRTVSAKLVVLPSSTGDVSLEGTDAETTTDADGYWHLDLVRGLSYAFRILEAGVSRTLVVPDADTAKLIDLLAA